MLIEDYQALAMRTSTEGHDRAENGCMGLIGESGEIVDAVKKWRFQSGENPPVPVDKLIDECGDVLWYCAELAEGLDEDMAELYERFSDGFYQDLHPINAASPLPLLAVHLANAAMRPYAELYDSPDTIPDEWRVTQAKCEIVGIMVTVREILELHCGSTLEIAMERNIDKLKRRYPDGFDPERSLHRAE